MRPHATLFLAFALAATACSGGGGSPASPPPGGGSGNNQAQSEAAISTANDLGTSIKSISDATQEESAASGAGAQLRTRAVATGACNNGFEFFAPDRKGDPNSTEGIYFYDSGCTQPARDIVRIYASTGSASESVARTVSLYAPNNATAIAVNTVTNLFTNATFDQYGFPIANDGYDRLTTGELDLSGSRTIVADGEGVMTAASGGSNSFCMDSAGYNATGFQKLGETFGWQGGVLSGGTRTLNSNGSVTWSATHAGMSFKGAIGSLSIQQGTQNTSCPIATPAFALAGGTQIGSYSIPVTVTYTGGLLTNLTVTNATLASGDTLNIATNTNQPPTSNLFIQGVLSNGSTQIATFSVDAFGDGTLTVTSSGASYVIVDWHVVH
ncbi:MAG: hypothetical protein ACREM8_00820 [Vulcanimicrobiaceae bacterium]